ncbi:LLM class flavin-dependent oxidoreductase [Saccharopolyspora tripterygii]
MYGLTIFNGGYGPERFRRATDIAVAAEHAGFEAVWSGELYSRSATVPMAAIATATDQIAIGSNIAYGVGRTPLMWAAEARDLEELSGGRIILGLGNGTPKMMENWHGVDGTAPAVRMEELIEVLRKLWRLHEGPVHHDGRFYTVHVVPTADVPPPYRERLPIWTAGVNPRMVRAAGKVADGLVGHPMFSAKYIDELVRPELAAGVAAAERSLTDVKLMGMVMCSVDEDEQLACRRLAFAIGQYAASRVYDRLFAMHGWSDAQEKIRDAARQGDDEALIAAVPDAAIDQLGVACTPDDVPSRIAKHAESYDHLNITVPPWGLGPDEAEDATRGIISAMRESLAGTTRQA